MARHKLDYGVDIINRLYNLVKIFNYHCEKEYPLNKNKKAAVDIAWLFEAEQRYPLFIFEVESQTTNSATNNASKIYGKTNQKFEKPLFLFHLFLTGGQNSQTIEDLEESYGTYNYRIYRFSLKEEINLIKDIISQHRRLSNKFPLSDFIKEIRKNWKTVNLSSVLLHVEELDFEKNSGIIIPTYAALQKKIPELRIHFIRQLQRKAETPDDLYRPEMYKTYLGSKWSLPIHLGLLSAFANDGKEEKYFLDFKKWQNASKRKKIAGYFDISSEYSFFILRKSGAVLSLTALLFYKVPGALEYIIKELMDIVKKSYQYDEDAYLYNCVWLLNLSTGLKTGKKYFEFARKLINKNGGTAKMLYETPPIDFTTALDYHECINPVLVPEWEEFRLMKQQQKRNPKMLFELAINYLTDSTDNWNLVRAGQM